MPRTSLDDLADLVTVRNDPEAEARHAARLLTRRLAPSRRQKLVPVWSRRFAKKGPRQLPRQPRV